MSGDSEKVHVPTNGHGPHTLQPKTSPEPPTATAVPTAAIDLDAASGPSRSMSFQPTPGQLAVGFGILASLILLLVGRRRRRGGE